MPHGPDPYVAFLSSLQDAYAASGGPSNTFTPGAQGVPGAAPGTADPGGVGGGIAGGAAGVGGGGASVPGTATTGAGILESINSGQLPVSSPSANDLVDRLFGGGGEPGERGDLGAGVTGGDLETLLAVLGGPASMPLILASLVMSDAMGLPPDPSLLGTTSLADLAFGGGDPADVGLTRDITTGVVSDINNINRSLDATFAANPDIFGGSSDNDGRDRGRSPSRRETTSSPGGIGGV